MEDFVEERRGTLYELRGGVRSERASASFYGFISKIIKNVNNAKEIKPSESTDPPGWIIKPIVLLHPPVTCILSATMDLLLRK